MHLKTSRSDYLISILVCLCLLSMRPSWLGEMYSLPAICVLWLLLLISYFIFNKKTLTKSLRRGNQRVMIPFILYSIITLFNASVRGDELPSQILSVIFDALVLTPMYYFLSKEEFSSKISRFFYFSILLVAISTVITSLLSTFLDIQSLRIATFVHRNPRSYLGSTVGVFLPLTPAHNGEGPPSENLFGFAFHRALNWFREPGATIAFITWTFIITSEYFKNKYVVNIMRIILSLAGILTFSTTVIYMIPICIFYASFIEDTDGNR